MVALVAPALATVALSADELSLVEGTGRGSCRVRGGTVAELRGRPMLAGCSSSSLTSSTRLLSCSSLVLEGVGGFIGSPVSDLRASPVLGSGLTQSAKVVECAPTSTTIAERDLAIATCAIAAITTAIARGNPGPVASTSRTNTSSLSGIGI